MATARPSRPYFTARDTRSPKSTPAGAATDFCSGIFIEKDREIIGNEGQCEGLKSKS